MKFRKRPVVVEATQWFENGDHPLDYSKTHDGFAGGELVTFSPEYRKQMRWEGDIVRYYRTPDVDGQTVCKHCGDIMHNHGWIDTLEGGHIVCSGDWIITGVAGEHYPCKDAIFRETYELLNHFDQSKVDYDAPQAQEPFCYYDGRDIVGKEFSHHSDVFPLYTAPVHDEHCKQVIRDIINTLMINHEAAAGRHNYFLVAANLIEAEFGETK